MTDQDARRCLQAFSLPSDNPFDDLLLALEATPPAAAPFQQPRLQRPSDRTVVEAAAAA
jgi:hypothetical protein